MNRMVAVVKGDAVDAGRHVEYQTELSNQHSPESHLVLQHKIQQCVGFGYIQSGESGDDQCKSHPYIHAPEQAGLCDRACKCFGYFVCFHGLQFNYLLKCRVCPIRSFWYAGNVRYKDWELLR